MSNYWDNPTPRSQSQTAATAEQGLRQFLAKTYAWMSAGLAITGATAIIVASTPALWMALVSNRLLFFGLIFAELGLVIAFTAALNRGVGLGKLIAMFLAYATLNGVTFSVIFLAYTLESIAQTFFITAASFGALSFYAYATKRDLSGMRQFLVMGLVGVLIASVVGLFWHNSVLQTTTSVIGVIVFAGLTVYDTHILKRMYAQIQNDEAAWQRLALQGALKLYLDFINLMLFLLRLMGKRR